MKRSDFAVFTASVTLAAFALPANAQNYFNACDPSSYVLLPGGQCLDLTYLEELGDSRVSRQQIERIYQQQFDANVELEMIYDQYPQFDNETEEEKNERYRSLAETDSIREDIVASNEELEGDLFPVHVRTMAIMRDAFVHRLLGGTPTQQE